MAWRFIYKVVIMKRLENTTARIPWIGLQTSSDYRAWTCTYHGSITSNSLPVLRTTWVRAQRNLIILLNRVMAKRFDTFRLYILQLSACLPGHMNSYHHVAVQVYIHVQAWRHTLVSSSRVCVELTRNLRVGITSSTATCITIRLVLYSESVKQ